MALPVKERFSTDHINRRLDTFDDDGYKCFNYKKKTFYILGKSNGDHLLKKRRKLRIEPGVIESQYVLSDGEGYLYESVIGLKKGTEGTEFILMSLETVPKS